MRSQEEGRSSGSESEEEEEEEEEQHQEGDQEGPITKPDQGSTGVSGENPDRNVTR